MTPGTFSGVASSIPLAEFNTAQVSTQNCTQHVGMAWSISGRKLRIR
jgi:hypothetical protein